MSTSNNPHSCLMRFLQVLLLVALLTAWHFASQNINFAFFFGKPSAVVQVIWAWFVTDGTIYRHLWVTLSETVLAFVIGTISGLAFGLWLGLSRNASALFDPYIKALNSMPRVILAPKIGRAHI